MTIDACEHRLKTRSLLRGKWNDGVRHDLRFRKIEKFFKHEVRHTRYFIARFRETDVADEVVEDGLAAGHIPASVNRGNLLRAFNYF